MQVNSSQNYQSVLGEKYYEKNQKNITKKKNRKILRKES